MVFAPCWIVSTGGRLNPLAAAGFCPLGLSHLQNRCRAASMLGSMHFNSLHAAARRLQFCPGCLSRNHGDPAMVIRKLKSGEYRLYSRKIDPKTGKRRNLGTFSSLEKAQEHERAVQ